jgi:hypothetical protein
MLSRTIQHNPLSDDIDELSPEKDRTLQWQHQRIAVQKEDVEVDENHSEDGLDDMFGFNNQWPQQSMFALTDSKESQGLLQSMKPQVMVSVCYMLYIVLY